MARGLNLRQPAVSLPSYTLFTNPRLVKVAVGCIDVVSLEGLAKQVDTTNISEDKDFS